MYVIENKAFYKNMHFHNISYNDTFYVNSTTKYAVICIPGHQKFEKNPGLWVTKMLVYAIKLAIAVNVVDSSCTET